MIADWQWLDRLPALQSDEAHVALTHEHRKVVGTQATLEAPHSSQQGGEMQGRLAAPRIFPPETHLFVPTGRYQRERRVCLSSGPRRRCSSLSLTLV